MATVSTYLNFARECEQAFNFYQSVFGGEFFGDGPMRFRDIPPQEGMPPLPEEDQDLILHIELKITAGYSLMGSDAPESMGLDVTHGNGVHINLQTDTREESDRLFKALSEGGVVTMPMAEQFWGDYFGSFADKFGVHWMINCSEKAN
ncbi:MAG: VOC family protein [Cyclobacterium sp.]|uniref:VOC family protein n=1 Tax=Cyclobacterium sp. TaxID=1966343 RepID=UPI003970E021